MQNLSNYIESCQYISVNEVHFGAKIAVNYCLGLTILTVSLFSLFFCLVLLTILLHPKVKRLPVAYNFGCRALYNLPWRASVSSHQVQCNIPTFEALLRKYKYLLLERCRRSNNIWLRALMQSRLFVFVPIL